MARELERWGEHKENISPLRESKVVVHGGQIFELTRWPIIEEKPVPLSEHLSKLKTMLEEKRRDPTKTPPYK